jgi:hypothetical protein
MAAEKYNFFPQVGHSPLQQELPMFGRAVGVVVVVLVVVVVDLQ